MIFTAIYYCKGAHVKISDYPGTAFIIENLVANAF